MLTNEILKRRSSQDSYNLGRSIWKKEKLRKITREPREGAVLIRAMVPGNYGYMHRSAMMLSNENEDLLDYSCDCYEGTLNNGMCRHCVALGITVIGSDQDALQDAGPEAAEMPSASSEQLIPQDSPATKPTARPARPSRPAKPTSRHLSEYMGVYNATAVNRESGILPGTVRLEPEFETVSDYKEIRMNCRIGTGRMYSVRNLVNFVHAVLSGETMAYGKNFSFVHSRDMLDEKSLLFFQILEGQIRRLFPDIDNRRVDADTIYRQLSVDEEFFAAVLELYAGETLTINHEACRILTDDPKIVLTGEEEGGHGMNLIIPSIDVFRGSLITWLLYDKALYRCSDEIIKDVLPFFYAVGAVQAEEPFVREYLSAADYEKFCGNVLPQLEKGVVFSEDGANLEQYKPQKPEFEFYINIDDEDILWMRPLVRYGENKYPLFVCGNEYRELTTEFTVRDLVTEYFEACSLPDLFKQENQDEIFRFLNEGTDAFLLNGQLFYDSKSKQKVELAKEPKMSLGVKKKSNLIDLDITCEDLPEEELQTILQACKEKKKYCRLKNGEYLSLEDGTFKVIQELAEGLGIEGEDLTHMEVPLYRGEFINSVIEEEENHLDIQRSEEFKQMMEKLRSYNENGQEVPETVQATLRSYQKDGFRWMATMAEMGLGFILADDMGLGKTLQMITLLTYLNKRTLIVCPASLLYNWGNEIGKFSPHMSVELIRGRIPEREEKIKNSEATIFVTSYDYLKKDIDLYADQTFGCIVIDEAQEIRNPGTQAAKSVKAIQADLHFALTGTPIENNLTDLWSIFDFIMPGYLFGLKQFHTEYELPIANGDEMQLNRLRRMVQPFMLRRKKEDVLQDLPEKVESVTLVEMNREQELLYRKEEQELRELLLASDDEELKKNKIEFLSKLSRLRQICCDPSLRLEGFTGTSGKVELCIEMLKQAEESDHHVLVFSQFTSMLEILLDRVTELGMKALFLSGRDSKEKRQQMVEQFQTGDYRVFFISLKAGGTGLTLTKADQVIHFDPWWNAAAEDQATDRAHRFGQQNTVFVTKLVAKDTIEERIVEMQENKKELSNSVISGGEISSSKLDKEQLLNLLGNRVE